MSTSDMNTSDMSTGEEGSAPIADHGKIYSGIVTVSKWAAIISLIIMAALMIVEVVLRYFASSPLGWNVGFIENVLLPGIVFLGMPWGYAVGVHVAADMVYDRMPESFQAAARALAVIIVAVGLIALVIGGGLTMAEVMAGGDIPPPLSSELRLPSWIWRAFLPVGSLATLVIVLIGAPRFIKKGEA
jgi:TRAP-type C4-dicarboxylate transport system permease small subunit